MNDVIVDRVAMVLVSQSTAFGRSGQFFVNFCRILPVVFATTTMSSNPNAKKGERSSVLYQL